MALDAANRAVQFLESGQATGAFILLTDENGVIIWDNLISADVNPIAQTSLILSDCGSKLRSTWLWVMSGDPDEDSGALTVIKGDESPE